MKVRVDGDRCEAYMKCEAASPKVFEVRDDDLSHVLIEEVPDDLVAEVEEAIRLCPRQAISWTEE